MSWRPLSTYEKACFQMSRQVPGYNVVRALRCNKLDLSAVQKSLDFVQSQHALLQSRVENDAFRIDNFPIQLQVSPSANWETEINRQANTRFDENGPFLRASAFETEQGTDLVISMPHAVGDGMSLNAVARHILTTCASFMRGDGQPSPIGATFAPPSMYQILNSTKWDAFRGSLRFLGLYPTFKPYYGMNFPCHDPKGIKLKDYSTAGIFRVFPGLSDFKLRCREEKVSVGNAFYALTVLAARDLVQSKKSDEQKRDVKCLTSITMQIREQLGVGQEDIGNFSMIRADPLDVPSDISTWELARRMAKFPKKEQFTTRDFHTVVTGAVPLWKMWIAAQRAPNYEMSPLVNSTNLGSFANPIPDDGTIRVKEVYALSPMAGHAPIVTNMLTTVGDSICLTFAYSTPTHTREDMDNYAERVLARLAVVRS